MSTTLAERHEHCTVVAEYNEYGAMTLQSSRGKTYQVVSAATQRVARRLAALSIDDDADISLRKAAGRGNAWRVVAVRTPDSLAGTRP
jgi:hypothetical protein